MKLFSYLDKNSIAMRTARATVASIGGLIAVVNNYADVVNPKAASTIVAGLLAGQAFLARFTKIGDSVSA